MRIIVPQISGQMGNQLVLIAHIAALCKEFGFRAYFVQFHEHRNAFLGPSKGCTAKFPLTYEALGTEVAGRHGADGILFRTCNIIARALRKADPQERYLRALGIEIFNTRGVTYEFDVDLSTMKCVEKIKNSKISFLFGWRYRNYSLLEKHKDFIREYLKPSQDINDLVESFFSAERYEKGAIKIGIHIRHGDYLEFEGGRYYVELNQYVELAKSVASQISRPAEFVVFSNEVQDLSGFAPLKVRTGPGSIYEDFHALSRCDLIIGPQSTFSGMASFLGQVPMATVTRNTKMVRMEDFEVITHFGPQKNVGPR